jgi:hypothetical protein
VQPFAVLDLQSASCGSAASSPMQQPVGRPPFLGLAPQKNDAVSRPRALENIRLVDFRLGAGRATLPRDPQPLPSPLAGLRILEPADEKASSAASCSAISRPMWSRSMPGGEPRRHIGPFLDDIRHPERRPSF